METDKPCRMVEVNGPTIQITARPAGDVEGEYAIGVLVDPTTREHLTITANPRSPFVFFLTGATLRAEIDLAFVLQEAAVHTVSANSVPKSHEL